MTGAERIANERKRQIAVECWTPEHDDEHIDDELAWAAVCYAAPQPVYIKDESARDRVEFVDPFPPSWDDEWDKRPRSSRTEQLKQPTRAQRIRMLEKAGALIAAEIDRLLRLP